MGVRVKKTSVFSCRVKKLTQNSVGRNHPIKKEVGKYKLGGKMLGGKIWQEKKLVGGKNWPEKFVGIIKLVKKW